MSISSLRSGLGANLATIAGLRVSTYIPDDISPPVAVISAPTVTYDTAFRQGLTTFDFTVTVLVGRTSERSAQSKLDAYCDPTGAQSVKAALESDQTLGGAAQALRVTRTNGNAAVLVGETTYAAVELTVVVYA
jgi:hypothetical protein